MQRQFYIGRISIPEELRPLYEEVSKDFEQKVFGALKTKKEKKNEKVRGVSKKFLGEREFYTAIS